MKKQVAISSVITVLIIFILAGCAKSQGDETESDTVEISTDSPASLLETVDNGKMEADKEPRTEPSFTEVDISDPNILMSLTAGNVFGDREWIPGLDAYKEVGLEEKIYQMEIDGVEGKEVYLYFIGVPSLSEPSDTMEVKIQIDRTELTFPLNGRQTYQPIVLPDHGTGKTYLTLSSGNGELSNVFVAIGQK